MAEFDSRKTKKPPTTGGRGKKSTNKESVSGDSGEIDDPLTCKTCTNVFVNPDDKLLQCERCDSWFCAGCLDMSDVVYKIMTERKDIHWFCPECENIEEQLSCKADKSTIEDLDARLKSLESKEPEKESRSESQTQGETVRLTIQEQREREYRRRNIIINNLPESKTKETEPEEIEKDKEAVKKVLSAIEVDEDDVVEYCARLGKFEETKTRMTKVTVKSVDVKRKILKTSRTLKDKKDFEEVFIGPDLTKMEQTEQYELRKELRLRKGKGETGVFIRRGRIVQSKDRALRFKGGATRSEDAPTSGEAE